MEGEKEKKQSSEVSLFRDTDDPSVGGMGKFDGLGMQVEAFILSPVKLVAYDGTMQT